MSESLRHLIGHSDAHRRAKKTNRVTVKEAGLQVVLFANTSWYLLNFRHGLICHLIEHGYRVHVVSGDSEREGELVELGVTFHTLALTRRLMGIAGEIRTQRALRRLLRGITAAPFALCTFTPKCNLHGASAVRGIKQAAVVHNISGLGAMMQTGARAFMLRLFVLPLYRYAVGVADWTFFQNREDMESVVGVGVNSNKRVERIPGSGVSPTDYLYRGDRARREVREYIFVGRLIKPKGLHLVVNALAELCAAGRKVNLVVLGILDHGHAQAYSGQDLDAFNAHEFVSFHYGIDDVRPFLRQAECIVLPTTYGEGVPRSLLEAAATGLIVVTTDWPGARDVLVDTVTGYLVQPASPESLKCALLKVADLNSAELWALGRKARQRVIDLFSEDYVIGRYGAILRDLG